jgi:hypothetical protein
MISIIIAAILLFVNLHTFHDLHLKHDPIAFYGALIAAGISYVSAIIIYLSFREQVKANKIQNELLKNEIESRKRDERDIYFNNGINLLRNDINSLVYTNVNRYEGLQALEIFSKELFLSAQEILRSNENMLNTIMGITLMTRKLLLEALKEKENRNVVSDINFIYSFKLSVPINTIIQSYLQNQGKTQGSYLPKGPKETLDIIMENHNAILKELTETNNSILRIKGST